MAQYQVHIGVKGDFKSAMTHYQELVAVMKECDFRELSLGVFHTRFDIHLEKGYHMEMMILSLQNVSEFLKSLDAVDTFKYKDTFSFSIARVNDYSSVDRVIWD